MSYFNYDGARPYKHKRVQTFSSYIHAVLKQYNASIGKKSMAVMNSLVKDTFDKLMTEVLAVLKASKKKTIDSKAIQSAVRLVLPGELAKHAVSEGNKADTTYEHFLEAKAKSKGKAVKDTKKPKISKSDASGGLKFPVGRILSLIKKNKGLASRVGVNAGIYLSAVLEYIASEIFDLAIKAAKHRKKIVTDKNDGKNGKLSNGFRINTRDLFLAIRGDDELKVLFKDTTIPSAGVADNIHKALLPKKSAESNPTGSKKSGSKKSGSKKSGSKKSGSKKSGSKKKTPETEPIVEKVINAVSAESLQNPAQNTKMVAALEVAAESASPRQAAAIEATNVVKPKKRMNEAQRLANTTGFRA